MSAPFLSPISEQQPFQRSSEAFSVGQVDVVVADDEDICRAAAASALKRFGFWESRVHEVESGDEALLKVTELQQSVSETAAYGDQQRNVPVIVFLDMRMPGSSGGECARQICELFAQQQLPREPFLVCASARRVQLSGEATRFFHTSVPKTFLTPALKDCFELCRQWWIEGGGEPGRLKLDMPPAPVTEEPRRSWQIDSVAATSSTSSAYSSTTPTLPAMALQATPSQSTEAEVSASCSSTPTVLRGGNSIESLDRLLPPRPPFEDVEMICLVGRGSFGRVYRARWDVATVALKVVEHYEQGKSTIMAFEGALSATLAHPNLVQTFKYSVRDTKPIMRKDPDSRSGDSNAHLGSALLGKEVWIVQEWCSLGTLNQKLSRKEIFEHGGFNEVIEVCAEIGSAASYLHSRGIIHGDLTASNVLLADRMCPKGYTAKVSDFGLARVLDNGQSGINTASMGTVTYMPPELFQLEGCTLTKKVDIYAFGVIMWQLCTSATPFEGLQPTQVVVMVAQGATLELPPSVPPLLAKVFKQSVARKPADRPGFDRIVADLLAMIKLDSPEEGGAL
mmetsp:Transcript_13465/g.30821  ORF Transcript_13465/g.30821 Transcript_13465/m.30821 type:complete len:566 (-) Transcript_13465:96-1793(-)